MKVGDVRQEDVGRNSSVCRRQRPCTLYSTRLYLCRMIFRCSGGFVPPPSRIVDAPPPSVLPRSDSKSDRWSWTHPPLFYLFSPSPPPTPFPHQFLAAWLPASLQHASHVHPSYATIVLSYRKISLLHLSRIPKNLSTTRRRRSAHTVVTVRRRATLGTNPSFRISSRIAEESNPLSA